jgi:hypothetical protein
MVVLIVAMLQSMVVKVVSLAAVPPIIVPSRGGMPVSIVAIQVSVMVPVPGCMSVPRAVGKG